MDDISTDRTLMVEAVERARLAPSVHNTQPWIFHVRRDGIDLLSDSSRALGVLDPQGRELTLSCGAALLHLRVALSAFGRAHTVELLPDPARPDILARVTLGSGGTSDLHARDLDRCADTRQTNRQAYHGELPADALDVLEAAAAVEHAGLQAITDESDRTSVQVWQQHADAAQITDPAYRRELHSWVNDTERADGVPLTATVAPAGPAHDFAARDFAFDNGGFLSEGHDEPQTAVLLLFTESDTPRAWLEAGQALARVWLEATLLGLVLQPLSQSVEDPHARQGLRSSLRLLGAWPQLLLRAGHASPQVRTQRRSTQDVLVLDPRPRQRPTVRAGELRPKRTTSSGHLMVPHST